MAIECRFPDVGEGIVEGEIRRWLVKEGDRVKADQPLVEVETDKALVELPAPKGGMVLKIFARAGEIIKVGQVVALIGEPDESPDGPEPKQESVSVVGTLEETPQELSILHPPVIPPRSGEEKVRAIPSVRKLAQELGVDLAQVRGSGADGRILREDVLRAAEAHPRRDQPTAPHEAGRPAAVREVEPPAEREQHLATAKPESPVAARQVDEPVERLALSRLRRTIAATMVQSLFTAPHVSTHDEVEVSRLMETLKQKRTRAEAQGIHLTLLPFIMKAVIAGLRAEPFLNAELDIDAGFATLKKYYHIGIATDTPEGLLVPVIRHADRKGIFDLAREITELTEKARRRTATLTELRGSTFTITNYGALGGIFGTPIINPPEVAILGLGRVQEKPMAREGQVVVRPLLPLSLSFDHRLIDGATAQRFLNTLMAHLQDPDRLF